MGVLWFSGQWDSSWWPSQNIVLLELYPVYVALQLWKKQLSNSVLALKTDNIALVSILTDFYSRNKLINSLFDSKLMKPFYHAIHKLRMLFGYVIEFTRIFLDIEQAG